MRVWVLMHVRLRVRARVRAVCVRACAYMHLLLLYCIVICSGAVCEYACA